MPDPTPSQAPPVPTASHLSKLRHDLRTPINHILGYCEMLLEDPPSTHWDSYPSDLNRIHESGERLLALVNSYLDLARNPAFKEELAQAQHDFRNPLTTSLAMRRCSWTKPGRWASPPWLPTSPKSPPPAMSSWNWSNRACFAPQAGMPKPEDSTWPVVEGPVAVAHLTDLDGGKVLVVDDHPLNREMLERRLRKHGFHVATAARGEETLALLKSDSFDLVLLDMVMPEMDGFQVLRRIKADRSLSGLPVIMLSAADEAATAVHCIKMGADDFLPKPCNTTLLLARIESALAKRHWRELRRSTHGFFYDQGTLQSGSPCYVERDADRELDEALACREFCYVLTSRQMGKSSLMFRTAGVLRERGSTVVVLDLTALGLNLTPEQWYDGLLSRIGRQLRLEDELEEFWMRKSRLGPVQRLLAALREVVLKRFSGPLVVFIDELDVVRSLPFSTDEFFAALREAHNARSEDPELGRLVFCLLGVATPSDLVRDTRAAPFNIGRRIELADFSKAETALLAPGLGREPESARDMMDRVFHWTRGHPYLTQRIGRSIAERPEVTSAGQIDDLVRELFLTPKARESDNNLQFVKRWMLSDSAQRTALWRSYRAALSGWTSLDDHLPLPVLNLLQLSGIVRFEEGGIEVRNRIYASVFDEDWLRSHEQA
ncbi:MAG: response regulator [Verrucomicrobia bacterium]|nr:response regulator [Verrucomicrobiota bacterium]